MIISILIWALILAESIAIGFVLARFLGDENPTIGMTTILLGLAGITAIAQFLSVFMPISLVAFLVIFCLSVVAGYSQRSVLEKINFSKYKPNLLWLPYLLIFAFSVAMAVREISNPDTNIYHAQAIRWIET